MIIKDADVFIGVSVEDALKGEWVKTMKQKAIVFALANPNPEIYPDVAMKNGCFIYASGRSDFPNQVNNSLVFPGIFRSIK
jgi:malate dehydrogenase (oxaloacetate-decarboxylating)